MTRPRLNFASPAWLVMAGVAATVYVAALIGHTVNWPYTDDHTATLGFLLDWHLLSTWPERLARLVAAHNEHRLVFNHLVELADVWLFGQIHFDHMVAVGNACWAAALAPTLRRRQLRWRAWAALCLLLWAMWLMHGWRQQAEQAAALRSREHITPPPAEVTGQMLEEAGKRGVFSPPAR